MKPLSLLLLLLISIQFTFGQESYTKSEIKLKTDSILDEARLLYKYEKSAWVASDLAAGNSDVNMRIKDYIVYHSGDTIRSVMLDTDNNSINEFTFIGDYNKPANESTELRPLNGYELNLINIKQNIVSEISNEKYNIGYPEGFNLNLVLIATDTGYKFYILTGTSQSNMIPFGNDYLFVADKEGQIVYWKKFHSRLIPVETNGPDGENIRFTTHSHLKTEPFISATDICTFKLYGSLYGLDEFSVYSPALSTYFTYNVNKDKITYKNK